MLFATGILSSICIPLTTADTIMELGIIDYKGSTDVFMEGQAIVQLNYISSDLSEEALNVEVVNFYSFYNTTNLTQIKFTSKTIGIDWTFKNNEKEFIYQDNDTKQLYRIKINYSNLVVPVNPWSEAYENLSKTYDESYNKLLELNNFTADALKNYTEKLKQYCTLYGDLIVSLADTNDKWNTSKLDLSNMSGKVSVWENNYNELEKKNKKLQGDLNSTPTTIIIYIFGTVLVMFIIFHFIQKSKPTQSAITEDAVHMGLDNDPKKFDVSQQEDEYVFKDTEETVKKEEEPEEKITDDTILNLTEGQVETIPKKVEQPKNEEENLFPDIDKRLQDLLTTEKEGVDSVKETINDKTEEITGAVNQSEKNVITRIDKLGKKNK